MKLTDDIVKAIHRCIEDSCKSVTEFANAANVSADTVTKYLRKETESIRDETWKKIHPLIRPYLPKRNNKAPVTMNNKNLELKTDERILLDAFNDLPADIQQKKLMDIVEAARKANLEKNGEPRPAGEK